MLAVNILLLVFIYLTRPLRGYDVSETVNPCDNYMEYACEGFNQFTESFSTIHSEASYRSATFIWETRASAFKMATDGDNPMLGLFFRSCMDRVSRNKYGLANFMEMLETYKGWPVLEECCANGKPYGPWSLTELIVESYMTGEANLMKLRVRRMNQTYAIEIKPAMLVLLNSYISNRVEDYDHYVAFLKGVIDLFDGSRDSPDIPAMLNLEQKIVKLKQQWRPVAMENLKISELQEKLGEGGMDMIEILKDIFRNIPWVDLTGDTALMVYDVYFFVEINEIFKKTPIRDIANYMIWRNVIFRFEALPNKFHKIESLRRMSTYLLTKPTQQRCLNKIIDYTFFKIYKDYLVKHLTAETQAEMEQMFMALVSTFDKSARPCFKKGLHEMDKLKPMKMVVGLQDTFTFDIFSRVYTLQLERKNYLANVIKMDSQLRVYELSNFELDGQVMKDRPLFYAMKRRQIIYDDEANVLYVPVNMFNISIPLDDETRPKFYGHVGTAVSYAMLRALSYHKYMKETDILECRKKQLNIYHSEDEYFLEDAFIGKALDLAFLAHKNYLRELSKRIREQGPIFVGFVQGRCTKDEAKINQTTRILINMFEFSTVYRCKSKEKLFMRHSRCIRDC